MHLNQLYGYFGRRLTTIETKNVLKQDLVKYYGSYTIFSEIDINDQISTILMSTNLDYDLINELKTSSELDVITNFRSIKSHVGIAAAVTAYARIEMLKYKTIPGLKIFYTDTDSIFCDKELPPDMVGSELGQMKDVLGTGFIEKHTFRY
jgi:hypothetical protein